MMDIGFDELEDLEVKDGDFTVVESTAQHQRQLILNGKGDFKESPTICVDAFAFLNDDDPNGLLRAIAQEFAKDGMDVARVEYQPDGTLRTDAVYK